MDAGKTWRTAIFAGVTLLAMALTLGVPVSAAVTTGTASSPRTKTVIDPFTLKVTRSTPVPAKAQVSDGARIRPWEVRVPSRPKLRSEFQPSW